MGRIRFQFSVLLFAFAASVGYAAEKLSDFVPAGSEYAVGVNAESLRRLAPFRNMTDETDTRDMLTHFEEDYHLRFSDCRELLFVGERARMCGLLARITVPEAELARQLRNFGDRFSLTEEAGRKIYCVRADQQIAGETVDVGVVYLAPDVVFAAERKYIAPFLTSSSAPENRRKKSRLTAPDGEPLVWSFLNVKSILANSGKRNSGKFGRAMLNGVNSVFAELNAIGDGGEWKLAAAAQCDDEESARQFALLVPVWLQLASSLLFIDDPALGAEFLGARKIVPDGRRVVLDLTMTRSFVERLAHYLGQQAKKRIIPPDPVPPDLQTRRPEDGRD